MSRGAVSAVGAALLLALLGLLLRDDPRVFDATSYGRLPSGHGALFDLLAALELPVARSFDPPEALPDDATVWWIAPGSTCHALRPQAPESEGGAAAAGPPPEAPRLRLEDFAARGGTAVVFLPARACAALGGLPLPLRVAGPEPEDPAARSAEREPPRGQRLTGDLVPRPRNLEGPAGRVFREAGGWAMRAELDGRPFVLERRVGAGRVAVVADAFFLRNAWLDRADAAPFVADLVRTWGVPRIDERQHGLRLEQGALRYLAASPARWPFAGLALLGVLVLWWGRAPVPRAPSRSEPPAPVLEAFVDALAALYARSRDPGRAAERYRDLAAAQLRRRLGLPPGTPSAALEEGLRRRGFRGELAALAAPTRVSRPSELRTYVRELDALVEEACR